jgi:hypothetical protein
MSEKAKITIKTERTLLLPTLPNFLRTEGDEAVPIESLTQEQLREIGQQWTDALLRKARDKGFAATAALNRKLQKAWA